MVRASYIAVVLISCVLYAGLALSADIDRGFDAFRAGDYATAFKEWKPLADAGDPRGQFRLASLYSSGKGVEKDMGEAIRLLNLSADQNYATAIGLLGTYYRRGEGVPKDLQKGFELLSRASEMGHYMSQVNLGVAYVQGEGVEQDLVQAYKWWRIVSQLWPGQEGDLARKNLGNISTVLSIGKRAKGDALADEWIDQHAKK